MRLVCPPRVWSPRQQSFDLLGRILHLLEDSRAALAPLGRDALADALGRFGHLGDDRAGFVAERVDADADAADEQGNRERRAEARGTWWRASDVTIGLNA